MANEHLVIQEEYLQEVIIVIESGILLSKDSVSKETKQNLQNWCDLHKRNIFKDVLKKYFEIIYQPHKWHIWFCPTHNANASQNQKSHFFPTL